MGRTIVGTQKQMELLKLQDAAEQLSVSYPTLKQWIYKGKIRSLKTAGGHHRIPKSEIDRLLGMVDKVRKPNVRRKSRTLDSISGRNKLLGTVTDVRVDGLLAQVTMEICGQSITSIITRRACEDLGLQEGVRAYALVKATEVMIIRD